MNPADQVHELMYGLGWPSRDMCGYAATHAILMQLARRVIADERAACIAALEAIPVDDFDGCRGYREVAIAAIRNRSTL